MNEEIDRAPLISEKKTQIQNRVTAFSSIVQLFSILNKRIVKGNQVRGAPDKHFFERQCSFGVTD